MIELVVVIVIIAVLAGAIVPRIAGMGGRSTEAAAAAIAEVLSGAARREALSSQRLAVDYSAETSRLRILSLSQGADGPVWTEAGASLAVQLGSTRITSAESDSATLDPEQFRVEFPQNTRRPTLIMTVESHSGSSIYTIVLPSGATNATYSVGGAQANVIEQSVDLDALGQGAQAW